MSSASSTGSRSRDLGQGVLASVLAKALTAAVPLITIPIALDYLGPVTYGLWMAASAATAMVAWLDLGLGNSLLTKHARAAASGDDAAGRKILTAGVVVLSVVAGLGTAIVVTLRDSIPWSTIIGETDGIDRETVTSVCVVCAVLFLTNLPLTLFQRTQYGWGKVVRNQVWQILGGIVSIALVWLAVRFQSPAAGVVAAGLSAQLLANVFTIIDVAAGRQRTLFPRVKYFDISTLHDLLRLSWRFLLLAIITSVASNIDPLIVSRADGLASVTAYSVPFRVFAILGMFITLVNTPLWPAVGRALAEGDVEWAKRACRGMAVLSAAVVALFGLLLLPFYRVTFDFLGVETDQRTLVLCSGFVVWWAIVASTSPRMMAQNAASVLRPQTFGWLGFLVLSAPVKYLVAVHAGFEWLPFVGALVYIFTVWWSSVIGFRVAVSQRENISQKAGSGS